MNNFLLQLPPLQRPLELGADLVLHSMMTKYLGGRHSRMWSAAQSIGRIKSWARSWLIYKIPLVQ
ncbi:MAG: PLP-dependent transferase [Anaerolineales bacterium]|nr:PLP-dependent transferase [Anaerolineales bacterium]